MAYLKFLIVAFLAASNVAFAGYAQLAVPAGWSAGTTAGNMYKAAANDKSFSTGVVSSAASVINVGGKSVTMPVAYQYASNAATFAATAGFGNPAMVLALAVGSVAYQWYTNNGEYKFGPAGVTKVITGETVEFSFAYGATVHWGFFSSMAATTGYASYRSTDHATSCWAVSDGLVRCSNTGSTNFYVNIGSRTIPNGREEIVPETDYVNNRGSTVIPPGMPQEIPIPLPVKLPIVNPTPLPSVSPGTAPAPLPQPLRVPQGEPQPVPLPVPNPENLPQTWRQPVVDVVPAPLPGDPWRVDVQPKDIIKTDPVPIGEPVPVPVTPPAGETTAPTAEKSDLCKDNPDILACAKPELDTPDEEQLGNDDKDISITPEGFGGGGSCPAPRHLAGANVDFDFGQLCDGLSMLRPVIIAIAWLAAGLILLGVRGGAD